MALPSFSRRPLCRCLFTALVMAIGAVASAQAQTYPTRQIRAIVPWPAGGIADVTARVVVQRLSENLGQPIVIENRTGASGTLGIDMATKAEPDGYTILISTCDFATTPSLMPKTAYEPLRDLIPVALISNAPLMLVASAASGFTTLKDVLAAAKAAPGAVSYASPGIGTINQLGAEWIGVAGNVKLQHVPYRGGAPAATAIATGEVQLAATTFPAVMPFVQAGKARVIGLMTKQKPSFAKDMPSIAESGLSDIDVGLTVGAFVPTGTPPAIVARLEAEIGKIVVEPAVREKLATLGSEGEAMGSQAFIAKLKADAARFTTIIAQTGVKPER